MCKFKAGDKVVRTGHSHSKIYRGQEYEISYIRSYGDLVLKGLAGNWDPSLFAPIPPKTVPHKHAELIKAWADGAVIEVRSYDGVAWVSASSPAWVDSAVYRIKPEVKPDRVEIRKLAYNANTDRCWMPFNAERSCNDPWVGEVKFTFDGETGKLKDVSILDGDS